MLSEMVSGPWDIPVNPEQLISVGVIVGEFVGSGVLEGVKVKVGGPAFVGIVFDGVLPDDGNLVEVAARTIVGVLVVEIGEGILDGVGDFSGKPGGQGRPKDGN